MALAQSAIMAAYGNLLLRCFKRRHYRVPRRGLDSIVIASVLSLLAICFRGRRAGSHANWCGARQHVFFHPTEYLYPSRSQVLPPQGGVLARPAALLAKGETMRIRSYELSRLLSSPALSSSAIASQVSVGRICLTLTSTQRMTHGQIDFIDGNCLAPNMSEVSNEG
jgi:hypothetical protein